MKHTHVIEADSAEEFKRSVKDLYDSLHDTRMTDEPQPPIVLSQSPAPSPAAASEEKPKKSKKHKEEVVAPPVVAAPPPVPATPAAEPEASADDIFGGDETQPVKAPVMVPYTMEDCQKRLQVVVSAKGIVRAKELLHKFGITKLVELPKDKFNSFITECDELT